MKALVIVAGSALDSYSDTAGETAAAKFAHQLYDTAGAFPGHVYVLSQKGPLTRISKPRAALLASITDPSFMLTHDVDVLVFDDGGTTWRGFLKDVRDRLISDGVDEAWVGGLWYDKRGVSGEVFDVYNVLFDAGIAVRVDESLTEKPRKKRGLGS